MGYHKQLLNHNKNHMNLLLGNNHLQFALNKQSLNGFFIDSEKGLFNNLGRYKNRE